MYKRLFFGLVMCNLLSHASAGVTDAGTAPVDATLFPVQLGVTPGNIVLQVTGQTITWTAQFCSAFKNTNVKFPPLCKTVTGKIDPANAPIMLSVLNSDVITAYGASTGVPVKP